jgi:hypothetical protein
MADLSRRDVLSLLGLGAMATGLGTAVIAAPSPAYAAAPLPPTDDMVAKAWRLLAPLTPGDAVGGMRIELVRRTRDDTIELELLRPDGSSCWVRICVRDDLPGAPTPVAQTEHYDFFVSNGARGTTPTAETDAMAVVALANLARQNEQAMQPVVARSLRQRWEVVGGGAL